MKVCIVAAAKLLQSCPTLWDPIDGSPPGFPGILQARTLEWVAISFSNAWKWKVKVKSLSRVRLFATPWTVAYQAPLSMDFPGKSTGVGCHYLLWCIASRAQIVTIDLQSFFNRECHRKASKKKHAQKHHTLQTQTNWIGGSLPLPLPITWAAGLSSLLPYLHARMRVTSLGVQTRYEDMKEGHLERELEILSNWRKDYIKHLIECSPKRNINFNNWINCGYYCNRRINNGEKNDSFSMWFWGSRD